MGRPPKGIARDIDGNPIWPDKSAGSSDGNSDAGGTDTAEIINPSTIGTETAGTDTAGTDTAIAEPKKRRGRKPGSTNKTKTARTAETQNLAVTITDTLTSVHAMLFGFTKSAMWDIPADDTARVADRTATVASFYMDLEVPTKVGAWINLGVALGSVYGVRYVMWRAMKEPKQISKPVEPKGGPLTGAFEFGV